MSANHRHQRGLAAVAVNRVKILKRNTAFGTVMNHTTSSIHCNGAVEYPLQQAWGSFFSGHHIGVRIPNDHYRPLIEIIQCMTSMPSRYRLY